ncbi:MAG: ASPIC/UnbV domain-containing protein [Verrucomicrobiales bacterium]
MRLDPKKGREVKSNETFENANRAAAKRLAQDDWGRKSLSGHERDRFFLSHGGRQFTDLSLLSGADHKSDGRAAALFDYNRDGRTDIAVASTNKPTLLLWKNELRLPRGVVAFRLIGGPGSNRDAIGARLTARVGSRTILRELHAGEGNAAQNSKTILVGLGDATAADSVTIRWPSGHHQEIGRAPAGMLFIVTEGDANVLTARYAPTED